ncbi:MAG: hypothetical protein H6729_12425 [Deltaproteobacteria bacterium]|nr:hypothetical protein [Deltaproteobacteria bacterium]
MVEAQDLAAVVLEFLLRGEAHEERYVFAPKGDEAVAEAIELTFRRVEDPAPSIEGLINLATVLEFEEDSPTAAGVIFDALMRHPETARVVERLKTVQLPDTMDGGLGLGTRDEVGVKPGVGLRRDVGIGEVKRLAPRVGDKPPKGSVKLSDMINVGDGRGRRPLHESVRPSGAAKRKSRQGEGFDEE